MSLRLVLAGVWFLPGMTLATTTPPANDHFTNRIALVVSGSSLTVTGSNLNAIREPGDPELYHGHGRTVWYDWESTRTGPVELEVFSPTYSEYFGIYVFTGHRLGELDWVPSGFSWDGPRHHTVFEAEAGTNYIFLVDGEEMPFFGPGDFVVRMNLLDPPPNDSFASRLLLAGRAAVGRGSTLGATREPDDPVPINSQGVHSVWWTWTAPDTGTATLARLDPAGLPHATGFYPTVGVYCGNELALLLEVTNNWASTGPLTHLGFPVIAGRAYQIMIAAKFWEQASVSFTVTLDGASLLREPKRAADAQVGFELIGAPWQSYRIESATELGSWQTVSNVFCAYGPVPLLFPQETPVGTRFFRAVLQAQ